MFRHCSSLKNLNISNFKTNEMTRMGGMFYDCSPKKIDCPARLKNKIKKLIPKIIHSLQ